MAAAACSTCHKYPCTCSSSSGSGAGAKAKAPAYDAVCKATFASRALLRNFIVADAKKKGCADCTVTSEAIATHVAETITKMGVISLNNRTTWPKDVAVPALVAKYTPIAAQFDLWATEEKEWSHDFSKLGFLVALFKAGCCDDIAALSFCLTIQTFPNAAVYLVQTGDIHSWVIVCGGDLTPWVVDAWTLPPRVCDLMRMERVLCEDKPLTFHGAAVNGTADLISPWDGTFKGAPAADHEVGAREAQVKGERDPRH